MSDVMERYKIPGWEVKARTFVVADGEAVQARLDLGHLGLPENIDTTQHDGHNVTKE